jgi:hypothetical protein
MKKKAKKRRSAVKAAAGSLGGKTTGDAKRRDMRGVKVGRGSAGRANKSTEVVTPRDGGAFGDVDRACRKWLEENDPKWGKGRFMFGVGF